MNHLGTTVYTAGNDRSIRSWSQTEEQLFVEEERENELEAKFDEAATTESQKLGEITGAGLMNSSESALVARTKASDESLKAGERVSEIHSFIYPFTHSFSGN